MRIAIVNDLMLAREALRRVVLAAGHSVAWLAEDGAEAVRLAARDRPDVVLMDLMMPVMDGVEATRRIMRESPCAVLLVTSSVGSNHQLVCEAMSQGCLDAVNTPRFGACGEVLEADALLARLERLEREQKHASVRISPRQTPAPRVASPAAPPLVALGSSTGGPEALARVLGALPASLPCPVVIAQHIGVDFVGNLVTWLQGRCALRVEAARPGERPRPGVVSIAATDDHLSLRPELVFYYTREPADYPYRPSANVLFEALARHWPTPGAAAVLTGMGSDGGRGLLALRQAGWLTLAQDAASSVVYGMPRAAAEAGAASRVLPPAEIGAAIAEWARQASGAASARR